jgi:hypothetical protein
MGNRMGGIKTNLMIFNSTTNICGEMVVFKEKLVNWVEHLTFNLERLFDSTVRINIGIRPFFLSSKY